MYVCICNAIRDNELRDAALRCTGDAEAVYALLGKTPQCRQCLDEAEEMIADGRLVRVLDKYCTPFPGYFLYYPSRAHVPAKLTVLVETLRKPPRRSVRKV